MDYDDDLIAKITLIESNTLGVKIKKAFGLLKISTQEMRHMRNVLKTEFKPIFANHIASIYGKKSNDTIQRLTIEFFDENIDRLPNDMISDMYMDFEIVKKYPEIGLLHLDTLFFKTQLSYSLHGWFLGKVSRYRFK